MLSLPQSKAREGLVADTQIRELGTIDPDSEQRITFKLSNHGPDLVQLGQPQSSCDCTVGNLSSRELAVGEQAELSLVWHAPKVRGAASTSAVIPWRSAAHLEDVLIVKVSATVRPSYELSAGTLTFTDGTPSSQRLELVSGRASLVGVQATHSAFKAKMENDRTVIIEFSPKDWTPDGVRPELLVQTNSTYERTVRVPLIVVDP